MGVDAVKQAWQPQPDPEIPVVTNSKLPLPKQSAVVPWGLLGAQLKIQPTRRLVSQNHSIAKSSFKNCLVSQNHSISKGSFRN